MVESANEQSSSDQIEVAGAAEAAGVAGGLKTGVDDDVGSGFGVTSRSATGLEADVGVDVCWGANMGGHVPTAGWDCC
jgi:hypothetical protein